MDFDKDEQVIRCAELLQEAWDLIRSNPIPSETTNEWIPLPMSQIKVMIILSREHMVNMGDVASALGINTSSATHLVDRLVEKGLVQRSDDPDDRRLVLCSFTEAGKKWWSQKRGFDLNELKTMVGLLAPEDLNLVASTMEVLNEVMRNHLRKNRAASKVEIF